VEPHVRDRRRYQLARRHADRRDYGRRANLRCSSADPPAQATSHSSDRACAKGEPVGASGLGQVFEIVQQLRGTCGRRQVDGVRVGLTHALGAGGNCSILIFRRQ
jgi:acetyl-CoA acetyltransferase